MSGSHLTGSPRGRVRQRPAETGSTVHPPALARGGSRRLQFTSRWKESVDPPLPLSFWDGTFLGGRSSQGRGPPDEAGL